MPRGSLPGERRGGRRKGTPNKASGPKRQFLKAFIDETQEEALACWKSIPDPVKRFDLWLKASEFAYPKLGRTELVGDSGGAIQVIVKKFEEA